MDRNDVDKLLNQMELKDFPYRAFDKGQQSALRVVRPIAAAEELAVPSLSESPASSETPDSMPIAVVPARDPGPIPLRPALEPTLARTATAVVPQTDKVGSSALPKVSPRVAEAFGRLSRAAAMRNAPPLDLQLNLPPRPPIASAFVRANGAERRLDDVFRSLHRLALKSDIPAITLVSSKPR